MLNSSVPALLFKPSSTQEFADTAATATIVDNADLTLTYIDANESSYCYDCSELFSFHPAVDSTGQRLLNTGPLALIMERSNRFKFVSSMEMNALPTSDPVRGTFSFVCYFVLFFLTSLVTTLQL